MWTFLLIALIVGVIGLKLFVGTSPGSLFTMFTDLRTISMQGKATPEEAASLLDRNM